MLPGFLLACFLLTQLVSSSDVSRLGPSFSAEPPALVRYVAAAGARVPCAARAAADTPRLAWLADDGSTLGDIPGIRRIHNNGTLELLPASAYGAEPAAATVRCRASNAHGTILSRDVLLQPVADVNWEVSLSAEPAAAGGVAALRCRAAGAPAAPALWYRGDRVLHIDPPTPESRYLVAGDALLIRDVSAADAGAYGCVARHALSAATKRARPAHLVLAATTVNSAPRLVATASEVSVPAGADFCIPCVASEYPAPQYTWYRELNGRLQPVESSGGVWLWAGGAALCARGRRAAGAWLCKAYNVFGDATAQVRVDVEDALTVTVAPPVLVAEAGSTVRFNCSASDAAAALHWLHDGAPLAGGAAGGALFLRGVARSHAGTYQCVARSGRRTAQAAAELRLGDSPPELVYTFIEQALRAGSSVVLRCAAAAAPPPRIAWLLDGQPVDHYLPQHRYSISEESSAAGETVSALNVSAATAADGGRYSCRASNALGSVEHFARLNIYGPPSIRAMGAVRAVAGENITVYCPYAGYPISSVSWWRRGAAAALGAAGRVAARGAALRLAPALPHDAGRYACSAAAPHGPAATRDLDIQVRNPPKISPFMFSSELTEGSSVQVLCGVSSGDKPMYFSWLKDGAPLPPSLQIEEKSLNEFSLLMFSELSARHSGAYTCRVANHAAAVNYTATLTVKVAPAWATEPLDSAVLLGAPLLLECAARGYPAPTVTWYRRISDGVAGTETGERWEAAGAEWFSGEGHGGGIAGGEGGGEGGVAAAGRAALTARAAARAHQGLYRCTADNGVGPPLVKHVNVTVHEPAHFGTVGESRNVSSVRGRGAALSCAARGDAPLTLHWTHRGNRLDLDSYRWTISEVRTSEGVRSTLTLRAAERGDAGEYRCLARNQYGRSELVMFLHVEEPPEAARGVRLGGAGARWVRVAWRGRREPRARWAALATPLHALPAPDPDTARHVHNLTVEPVVDDGVDEEGFSTLSSVLRDLRPATAYSLRLFATNHVGQSPHSDALLFTTLEEAPTGSPQNVRIRPINSGELHVTWAAPLQDTWNGELLGYVVSWRELDRFESSSEEVGEGESEEERGGRAVVRGWSSTELALGGLRQFARYALAARAFNRAGAGPPSPTVYATTADGAVPSEAPRAVSCEAQSARSVRVRWTPPHTHAHLLRGYDLHYAPLHFSPSWSGAVGTLTARTAAAVGAGGEAMLQGLRAATNYTVSVRARNERGAGPPSPPAYCATTEDVPSAVESLRALPAAADAVRVVWLAPTERGGRLTHYALYTRELGKVSGEWSQRVEVSETAGEMAGEAAGEEVWHEVRGLRERVVYEFWVRAATAAGPGPPSRAVTAAPTYIASARISSVGREVRAALGARLRLRCAALGAPPLARRWAPLPAAHTLTDTGDLVIHKVEQQWAGNYSCSVRNALGADAAVFSVRALLPPAAPAPRLARAAASALHLTWDPPHDGGAPILGYTVWWWRGWEVNAGAARWARVASGESAHVLRGLACGAPYRVALRAHNVVGTSPHSRPLHLRTRGDKAKAPPGKECIWANSTTLRLSLLAWGGRCPVATWNIAYRLASTGTWTEVLTDGEVVEVSDLQPGTWYEFRVLARSPAGETPALYRAATHTQTGERIGEPIDLPVEARMSASDGTATGSGAWRGALAAALGAALALGAAALLLLAARRRATRRAAARTRAPPPLFVPQPPHTNGKTLSPPDGELHEISPYATFSMSSGTGAGAGAAAGAGEGAVRGCALHLRSFAREPLELAAPPPRPQLIAHANEYGRCRDSDSESSGSPCAACAAELYRLPAARLSDTLPVSATAASVVSAESSTEDASYAAARRHDLRPDPRHDSRHDLRHDSRHRRARRRDLHAPTVRNVHEPQYLVTPEYALRMLAGDRL
ncbi:cell adhesion molecule Dscam2-like [Epargyreus clarus]|uniref:cell adhesion molecule Dscam2-like n=1 Tax=Epargyreus clarus TaxID=520877 RepID=UPI003C2FFF4F